MTGDIAAGIRDQQFVDGVQMERLVDAFAGYYIRATYAEIPIPRCWQATWDVAADPNLVTVQHLLFGTNAHVNPDLAQAVVEVARITAAWRCVTTSKWSTTSWRALSSGDPRPRPGVAVGHEAAMFGGGRLFNFSLRLARSQAWGSAERPYPMDEARRREYTCEFDQVGVGLGLHDHAAHVPCAIGRVAGAPVRTVRPPGRAHCWAPREPAGQ